VADNFCGLGNPPNFSTYGLRVAGRLSASDAGLVVFTSDTALARRLAAADVDETWRVDLDAPAMPETGEKIVAGLAAINQAARIERTEPLALTLTTASLGKGQLSALCGTLGLRAAVTRIRRGEIVMGDDVPEGQWLIARSK